jgi:hypothetical protein
VPAEPHLFEVIHSGTAEGTVRTGKPVGSMIWASTPRQAARPQNRAGVLRDVGLVRAIRMAVVSALDRAASMLKSPIVKGFVRLLVIALRAGLRSLYKGANKRRRIAAFRPPQDRGGRPNRHRDAMRSRSSARVG